MKRFTFIYFFCLCTLVSFSQISYRSFYKQNYKIEVPTFLIENENSRDRVFWVSNFSEKTQLVIDTYGNDKTKNFNEIYQTYLNKHKHILTDFKTEVFYNSFYYSGFNEYSGLFFFYKVLVNPDRINELRFCFEKEFKPLFEPVTKRFEVTFVER
jgi:hypothetical protein